MSDIEFVLGALRLEDWTALSEIEQVMSLAIARYALGKLRALKTLRAFQKVWQSLCSRRRYAPSKSQPSKKDNTPTIANSKPLTSPIEFHRRGVLQQ